MKKTILTLAISLLPLTAFGAIDCSAAKSTLNAIVVCATLDILGTVVPFLVILATAILLVGILRFVAAGDNEEKRQGGRDVMVFGIIVLFIMVSLWGIVKIMHQSLFSGGFGIPNHLPRLM